MAIDMSQFHEVFFDETAEHLATMESLLLYLDPQQPDPEQIEDIYRAAHSIKGSSGTFNFQAMAELAQRMQTLLDPLRSGGMPLPETAHAGLIDACRAMKRLLAAYRSGDEGDAAEAARIGEALAGLADGASSASPATLHGAPGCSHGQGGSSVASAPSPDFAAMAGGLRDLAQRAAAASSEVVQLMRTSAAAAKAGPELAREAEESIGDLMSSFSRLEHVVVGMAAAASGPGLGDIAEAVRQLGRAIRHNETLARQAAISAESLQEQFEALTMVVARRALPGAAGQPAGKPKGGILRRASLPKFRRSAEGAGPDDDWMEF